MVEVDDARRARCPMFKDTGNKRKEATTKMYVSLGLFAQGGDGEGGEPPSLRHSAHVELSKLRAMEASRLMAELSCEGVLIWWKRWADSYLIAASGQGGTRGFRG